jgi:hypothetical protein
VGIPAAFSSRRWRCRFALSSSEEGLETPVGVHR